jgi:hypothetical protein
MSRHMYASLSSLHELRIAGALLREAWREKTFGLRSPAAKDLEVFQTSRVLLEKLRFSPDPSDPPRRPSRSSLSLRANRGPRSYAS